MKLKLSWPALATLALAVLLFSIGFTPSGLQAQGFPPGSSPASHDILLAQRPPRSDYFRAPFRGSFRYTNGFDHDVPQQFRDANGYVVTWQGVQLPVGSPGASIDGHEGYDWRMPEGTPLIAVGNGTVEFAGEGRPFTCPTLDPWAIHPEGASSSWLWGSGQAPRLFTN